MPEQSHSTTTVTDDTLIRSTFIDPLSDFGFKRIFGNERDKEILITFLNTLFDGEIEIVDLEYGNTAYDGEAIEMQKVYFDLTCIGKNGEKFLIEMQRQDQKYFNDRTVFYLSRMVNDQFKKGETNWKNKGLKKVYLVGILEFELRGQDSNSYLHDIALTNTDTKAVFYDKLGLKFIVLPKFVKTIDELSTDMDKWIYLCKNLGRLTEIPAVLDYGIFRRVFKIARIANLTEEERKMYDKSLKAKTDYENSIAYAQEIGLEKGRDEERNIAIEEKRMAARKMLSNQIPIDQVAVYINLPIEEIESL